MVVYKMYVRASRNAQVRILGHQLRFYHTRWSVSPIQSAVGLPARVECLPEPTKLRLTQSLRWINPLALNQLLQVGYLGKHQTANSSMLCYLWLTTTTNYEQVVRLQFLPVMTPPDRPAAQSGGRVSSRLSSNEYLALLPLTFSS